MASPRLSELRRRTKAFVALILVALAFSTAATFLTTPAPGDASLMMVGAYFVAAYAIVAMPANKWGYAALTLMFMLLMIVSTMFTSSSFGTF